MNKLINEAQLRDSIDFYREHSELTMALLARTNETVEGPYREVLDRCENILMNSLKKVDRGIFLAACAFYLDYFESVDNAYGVANIGDLMDEAIWDKIRFIDDGSYFNTKVFIKVYSEGFQLYIFDRSTKCRSTVKHIAEEYEYIPCQFCLSQEEIYSQREIAMFEEEYECDDYE